MKKKDTEEYFLVADLAEAVYSYESATVIKTSAADLHLRAVVAAEELDAEHSSLDNVCVYKLVKVGKLEKENKFSFSEEPE